MEKPKSPRILLVVAAITTVFLLILPASPASATTFCVPAFHAGCPDNGSNVAEADLEVAVKTDGNDGTPDRILMGAYTYTDPDTLQTGSGDQDDLEIIGSGTGQSQITSSDNGNQFVVDLNYGSRTTDMSNLTIVVPASFPDGSGGGIQARDGVFDHVDIESRNLGSDGAPSLIGNTVWKNSRIYGAMGGSIGDGIEPNEGGGTQGKLEIYGTTIEDAVWALSVSGHGIQVELKRSRIVQPIGYGVRVSNGGMVDVENSVIEGGGQAAFSIEADDNLPAFDDTKVTIDSSTIVRPELPAGDPPPAAIEVEVTNQFNGGDADVSVSNSIIRDFEDTWAIDAPIGPGYGVATLTIANSNFSPTFPETSGGSVDVSEGNIDQDPKFAGPGDYRLSAGSPSIDAGDPAPGGTLEDFDGNVRPLDGNGDGSRVRDQGAFEAAEIPTCATDSSLCPVIPPDVDVTDVTKPKVSKVKFKAPVKTKAGWLKLNLSEAATIKATFKPTPAAKGKKKRKLVKLGKKGKAGANRLLVKKRRLKPGRYRLTVVAIDAAGNRSKAIIRKVKVKGKA